MTLVYVWAFLLSLQLPAFAEGAFAMSDVILAAGLGLTFTTIRLRPGIWSAWHFAMPVYLAVSALLIGPLSGYTIGTKVIGLVVLLASYLFVTSNVWTWSDIARTIRFFYLGVVAFSFLGLVNYALAVDLPFMSCQTCDIRLLAFMPDAHLFGSLAVLAIASHIALGGSRFAPVSGGLRWPPLLVLITALALSSSRPAWLALCGVVLVAIATKRKHGLRSLLVAISAVAATALVFAAERVLQFVELAVRRHGVESRLDPIDHGMEAFLENPLTGIGIGSTYERFGQTIHNTLFWIGGELGVIGLVIFGGFLVWIIARLAGSHRGASEAHRPLVLFLIMGNVAMLIFSFSVEAFYQRHWWLLFALTASASALTVTGHRAGPVPFPVGAIPFGQGVVGRRLIPGFIVLSIFAMGVLVVFTGTAWLLDRSAADSPEVLAKEVAADGGDDGLASTTIPGGEAVLPLGDTTSTTIVFGLVPTTIPGAIRLPTLPAPTTTTTSPIPSPTGSTPTTLPGPTGTQPPPPVTQPPSPSTTQPGTTVPTTSPPSSSPTTSTATTAPTTTTTTPTTTTTEPTTTTTTEPTTTTTTEPTTTTTNRPPPTPPTLPPIP